MTKYIFTRDLPPTLHKKGDVVYDNEPIAYVQQLATWLALGYIEEVKEEEWPQNGDVYYAVYEDYIGDTITSREVFDGDDALDNNRKAMGNCYRTEVEALEAKKRVEQAYKGI